MIQPHNNPKCACGEELKTHEQERGICFTCHELENNRRYRQHHDLGEYRIESGTATLNESALAQFKGLRVAQSSLAQ